MRHIVIICTAVSILLGGCSEKPERKAAKEIRKSTEKTNEIIKTGQMQARSIIRQGKLQADSAGNVKEAVASAQEDFNKARMLVMESFEKACSELERSVQQNRRAGSAATIPAVLTNGNLLFSQALNIKAELPDSTTRINRIIDSITQSVTRSSELVTRKELLGRLIEAGKKDIRILQNTLNTGTESFEGLKDQLAAKTGELSRLLKERKNLQAQADQAKNTANTIEKLAADKLRQADKLKGNKKLELQNKAYELMFSKKEYAAKLQSSLDKLEILESKIAIVQPMKEKLESDIKSIENKIAELKSSGGITKLNAQINDIANSLDKYSETINKLKSEMSAAIEKYNSSTGRVVQLLSRAIEKYQTAKSSPQGQAAKGRIAACSLWMASTYAESTIFAYNIQSRLNFITEAEAGGQFKGKFTEITSNAAKISIEHGKLAMENYSKAIEVYKNVGASGDLGCTVLQSRILALYGKVAMGIFIGDTAEDRNAGDAAYEESDKAAEAAAELIEEAEKCDPAFARSITAKMLAGENDYTPKMKVDMAADYEEKRKQFQAWTKLRGEEKKAEVEKLLGILDDMNPPEDPEAFEKILGPERKLLEEALRKGFDDEEDLNTGNSYQNDPNSIY